MRANQVRWSSIFMAPPAHTDPKKWAAMRGLADHFLTDQAIEEAGVLSTSGVKALFDLHDDKNLTAGTQNNLDALINHMLGVQVMHKQLIATDIPTVAKEKAASLGWFAKDVA